jgi:hypothetical protein
MENLDRLVADTLAQSGFETPVYLRPIPWSRWFRCESSFSLLLVPSAPGLYALAEEIVAPGEASAKRMLAVFDIGETDDLCVTLSRHFAPSSPLSERLSTGRCFVRFAQFRDVERRRMVCNSLKRWLAASSQAASGLPGDASPHDIGIARDFSKADTAISERCHPERSEATAERSQRHPCDFASSQTSTGIPATDPAAAVSASSLIAPRETVPEARDHTTESRKAAAGDEPPPLPSGF